MAKKVLRSTSTWTSCLLSDIHVHLPFDEFMMGILRVLNITPTQLHPNNWAALQAFYLLCEALHAKSFFLTSIPDRLL
ncbi:unnamed protein product, partial [Sphenostylis stenocarpa]